MLRNNDCARVDLTPHR